LSVTFLWSRELLLNRSFLWLLFCCNLLGTVGGYVWYDDQLAYTWERYPHWLIVFVPDSPTASLFFTIALLFLLFPPADKGWAVVRHLIEGLAVVTSVKYGIWASAIIFAGASQGGAIGPLDWMLVASHTIMAVEALVYIRFFAVRSAGLTFALLWTLLNDLMDYTYGINPWLPRELFDDVPAVRNFTVALTLASAAACWLVMVLSRRRTAGN
jgi:uncharacterized membrane protein YpjA